MTLMIMMTVMVTIITTTTASFPGVKVAGA
jgi:hypothetical protein